VKIDIYLPTFRRRLLPPLLSGLNKRYYSEERSRKLLQQSGTCHSRGDHTPANRNPYFLTLLFDLFKDCLSHVNPREV